MKIEYLDLFYRINGDLHQILTVSLQTEIPVMVDDLRDLEMYEIMRMPVIRQPLKNERSVRKQANLRLKILCCSYLPGGFLFIYLFSGDKWNYYLKYY